MSQDICIPIDPGPLCVDRVVAVLREGFPDLPGFPSSPASWTDPAAGAPIGHWLLPAGCRLFRGDEPEDLVPPACIVWQSDKSSPTRDDVRLFWLVPLTVSIRADRVLDRSSCQRLAQSLQTALCEDLLGSPVRERLSCPGLRVRGVRSVEIALPELDQDWNSQVEISFTLFCSATSSPDL